MSNAKTNREQDKPERNEVPRASRKMTKAERRKIHRAINGLSHDQVAAIVRRNFPQAQGARVDELAKQVIAGAHRQVSPQKTQRG